MSHSKTPGRVYRGTAAGQRREERRARLLAAAVEVFGTDGYRSATVDKICATAGLTKRYFYESFAGSEELLLAAYDHAVTVQLAALRRGAAAGADPDSRIRGALTAFFAAVEADPRLARIAFLEILGVSEQVDRRYRRAIREFIDVLLADHTVGPDGVHHRVVATGLLGAVLMIAQQWLLTPRPQPIDTAVAAAHAIVVATLGR